MQTRLYQDQATDSKRGPDPQPSIRNCNSDAEKELPWGETQRTRLVDLESQDQQETEEQIDLGRNLGAHLLFKPVATSCYGARPTIPA